jgi:regulatory protein
MLQPKKLRPKIPRMSRRRPEPPPDRPGEEADPESVVRAIVLRRLSRAPRTRSELETDLARRGADPDACAAVLDRFEEVGLIDDASFAHAWVESRHRSKALARSVLRRELTHRGVDREVVDEAMESIDDEDEWQRAREFARKKFRARREEDPLKAMNRLAGQLARKGYPANVCFTVAREVLAAVSEQGEQDVIDQIDAGLIVDDFSAEQESV